MTRTALRIVPALLLMLWMAPPGRAAAPCSVPGSHATIQAALDDPSCDPISVAPGTYVENLDIDRSVSIQGAGSALTTIDGSLSGRVVTVDDSTTSVVTLEGMAITRGMASASAGGGIVVSGAPGHALTLDDVVVTKNISTDLGGGVAVFSSGSLEATNTTISMNEATGGPGGGLYVSSSSATLTRVLVDGNEARDDGGGIYATDSALTVQDGAVTNNSTDDFGGIGGVAGAIMTLTNVTLSGNQARGSAGGVGTDNGGTLTATNVTVSGNTSDADATGGGDGGGVARFSIGGPISFKNSIVAGNTDGSPAAHDCAGSITSSGNNIVGSTPGCLWAAGSADQLGVDPMLAPLADNGGNTLTHALLPGSPAIDAADPAAAPPTDQRGLARNPDIGAYELTLCAKVPVNRFGTEGNDALTGTSGPDGMLGLGGKDTLSGLGGKDALCGGSGKDKLRGGGGKDVLKGQGGKDTCLGGGGKDKAVCEKERKI